jgi:hypothetical protein
MEKQTMMLQLVAVFFVFVWDMLKQRLVAIMTGKEGLVHEK